MAKVYRSFIFFPSSPSAAFSSLKTMYDILLAFFIIREKGCWMWDRFLLYLREQLSKKQPAYVYIYLFSLQLFHKTSHECDKELMFVCGINIQNFREMFDILINFSPSSQLLKALFSRLPRGWKWKWANNNLSLYENSESHISHKKFLSWFF